MLEYSVQIVTPVYNSSKTLKKCLDSLLNQTFKAWQVILVDDASKDNSLEVIKEYALKDKRIKFIALEKNGGSSNARNQALKIIDAEYVAFLDSDDYWEPQMLERMINQAKEYDCDVVQCRFIYDFPGGRIFLPAGAFSKEQVLEGKKLRKVYRRMMTGINMNHVCMKLIRAELIKGLSFDTSLSTAEDLELCVRLFAKVKKYSFITDVMYHYCRYETSLTGSSMPFKTRLNSNRAVAKVMAAHLKKWGINTPCYKLLTYLRPYTIIISKVIRIIREKILKK